MYGISGPFGSILGTPNEECKEKLVHKAGTFTDVVSSEYLTSLFLLVKVSVLYGHKSIHHFLLAKE